MKNLQPMIIGLLGAALGTLVVYLALVRRAPNPVPLPGAGVTNSSVSVSPSNSPPARAQSGNGKSGSPSDEATPGAATAGTRSKGSAGVDRTAPKPSFLARPYQRVFVLSVGVNRYPGAAPDQQLRFATNDAAELAATLKRQYGFAEASVLLDDDATRDRIGRELTRIAARMSQETNDDFVFFFSGHGQTAEERLSATNSARRGFLLPYDPRLSLTNSLGDLQQRAIDMQELVTTVMALPARHRLLFLDSCFSGLAFVKHSASVEPPAEVYREIITHPTVQILTAGLEGETTLESDELRHGLFTQALLGQLEHAEVRSMEEVFLPLRVTVRDFLARHPGLSRMTPQHRYIEFQAGTFVFVPTNRLDSWADQSPTEPMLADARQKGFYRPVGTNEVANIRGKSDSPGLQQDRQWQAQIERYEARAAMGDAYAQLALIDIYRRGLGTKPDEARSRLWAREGQDAVVAGLIKDPVVAQFVDSILIATMKPEEVERVKGVMKAIDAVRTLIGGGGPSADGLRTIRVKLLNDLKLPPNYPGAQKHFETWQARLTDLDTAWRKMTNPPPEIEELKKVVAQAQDRVAVELRGSASNLVFQTAPIIDRIEAKIPKKPGK